MVLRKWLSSLINGRPQADRPRRRSLNQPQRDMRAAAQLSAEPLEGRQLLTASIAGIDPDHGVDATDELTNVGTFDLHGSAAGDSVLQITRNGNFVGAILVNSDGEWRFAQTGLAQGTYAFAATDGEGAASLLTVQVDKTAPTATLSTSLSLVNPTNASTLPISLNFSEAVDGLSLSDLAIGNGAASNLSGSGSSYSFDVTPTGDGAVTIGLNASSVIDLAGNSNGMSATLSIDSDRTAPTAPSVSDPSGSGVTNSGSVTIDGSADAGSLVRLYRDADASGTLSDGDTQVDQQQLGGSETSFLFNAGLTADAANRFLVTATDSATNESAASAVPTITQDSTSPSVSIAFGVANPTNATSIPVTVDFSEAVSGFDASDVSVGNGSISDFVSVSPTQATFNVTQAADGNVTIDIAAAAAVDLAGNASNAATQASIVSDTTKPTVSFTSSIDGVSNVSVIGATVAFSESVSGFDLSDLAITNGSASDLTGSGSSYSFNLTPAGDGEVIVSLAAGSVADAAGNSNDAAELQIRSDRTAPSAPSVTSPAADVATNATSFDITGTISPVEDTLVRVYRDGSTSVVGEQLLLGGSSFSISVPLTANSTNRFVVTSTDAAGNVSVATTTTVITQDSIAPQTSISVSSGSFTNEASIAVAISFTEDVIGFEASDVSVGNGTVSDFVAVDGSHYTLNVIPSGDGLVTIDVAAGATADAAGNGNEVATQRSFVSDRTAPEITLTPSVAKNGNGWNNTEVTVSYSVVEANIDAEASDSTDDLLTASGTASATVTDLAGNSTTVSYETLIDKVAPTLTASRDITANENGWNNSDVTVTFEASDDLSGGVSSPAAQVFSDGFDQTASATVTDLAGNSTSVSIEHISVDKVAPTLTASRDLAANENGWNNSDVTVTFEASDALSGGVSSPAAQVFGDGFDQTASATVTDLAGNSTTVSIEHISVDKVAPTLTASRDIAANENGWNNSDVTVTFEASDALSGGVSSPAAQVFSDGFDQTASATVTDLAGNSTSVSIEQISVDKVAPTLTASRDIEANENGWNNSDVTVRFETYDALSGGVSGPFFQEFGEGFDQTASATVTDLAGNSTSVSIEHINVDKTAPAVSVISAPTEGQEGSELHFALSVSDSLSGISSTGWDISGGPQTTGSVGDSSLDVTPLDNGLYSVAYSTTDAAGNSSSLSWELNIANVAPTAGDDSIGLTGDSGDDNVSLIYEDDVLEGEGLLDNDSDPAGANDPLTVIEYDTISEHGAAVTVESDGSFTYDPTLSEDAQSLGFGEVGIDTFGYTISDGDGGTSHATVSVEVHGVNDAPVLNDTTAVRLEAIDANDIYGQGVDIETFALDRIDEVDATDSIGIAVIGFSRATTRGDWQFSTNDGASWTTINSIGESHALHLIADGHTRLRLRPDGSHTGTARLTLRAWDGSNDLDVRSGSYAAISGTGGTTAYSSKMLTVRQTVLSAAKDATIAVSDTFDVDEYGQVIDSVLTNDIDPDSQLPQAVGVHFTGNLDLGLLGQLFGAPGDVPDLALTHYGVLTHNIDGSFNYQAEPNFFAALPEGESVLDGFTYFVTDGKLTSNVAGVSIVVTGVNDAPEATSMIENQVVAIGEEFEVALPEFIFQDVDTGDSLTITVTQADGSDLPSWLEADEESYFDENYLTLSGVPSAEDLGAITIRVTATDSHGASASIDFDLEVFNSNHAPTAGILDDVSVNEGDTLSLTLPADLFFDEDAGDHLSLSIGGIDGNSLSSFFAFNAETGMLTVTPSWDAAGVYTVVVTATDTAGESVSKAFNVNVIDSLITIHVAGQADDPNEAWSLFADDQGFLHITRNGNAAIAPLPLDEVFAVYLDTGDGNDTVALAASLNSVVEGEDSGDDEDNDGGLFINLGDGNDSVDATALQFSVLVLGGDGNDLMLGGTDADFFSGEAGNDTLLGAGGDDLLLGGDGNDTMRGGAGADIMDGGDDHDLIYGQGGPDVLIGGNGNDYLDSGVGNDLVLGGAGNDTVQAGTGNDSVFGGEGNDYLDGGAASDVVIGGAGNDTVVGNDGNDTLIGGFGTDVIRGGSGADVAVGGQGGANRGGNSSADSGDSITPDVESLNETFDIAFDWEVSGLGPV